MITWLTLIQSITTFDNKQTKNYKRVHVQKLKKKEIYYLLFAYISDFILSCYFFFFKLCITKLDFRYKISILVMHALEVLKLYITFIYFKATCRLICLHAPRVFYFFIETMLWISWLLLKYFFSFQHTKFPKSKLSVIQIEYVVNINITTSMF